MHKVTRLANGMFCVLRDGKPILEPVMSSEAAWQLVRTLQQQPQRSIQERVRDAKVRLGLA